MNSNDHAHHGTASRRSRIAFWVIAAIAAYFLLVEHREHFFSYLPFVLILLCPLLHVFHHGHGAHGHDAAAKPGTESRPAEQAEHASDRRPHGGSSS